MSRIGTWALALALVVLALGAHGCNTVRGVGKDIQRGGQKIEEVAK